MSKQRALKRMKDCFRLGMGEWTESESDCYSETAKGSLAEVHCYSLAPENVGLCKKKWKLSLTKPKKSAPICPYPIKNIRLGVRLVTQ